MNQAKMAKTNLGAFLHTSGVSFSYIGICGKAGAYYLIVYLDSFDQSWAVPRVMNGLRVERAVRTIQKIIC